MHNLPRSFFGWGSVFLYIGVCSVFFLAFAIVYNPFGMQEFLDMGRGLYTFNLSIMFAISLAVLAALRTALHFMKGIKHFTWSHYVAWCMGECLVLALFFALYLTLMLRGKMPYFSVLFNFCIPCTFLILIYPYLILSMAYSIGAHKSAEKESAVPDAGLIRFYDQNKNPKLLIAVSAVLYLKAEENYVNIWYRDNGKAVRYSLRSSMTALEDNCRRHGLVRCQRSYFVNPGHVTILRKENGFVYADLDVQGVPSIPVSKRYYDTLSALL